MALKRVPRLEAEEKTPEVDKQEQERDRFISGAPVRTKEKKPPEAVPVPRERVLLVQLNTRIPLEIMDLLDGHSRDTGISKQKIITDALSAFLR